MKDSSAGRDSHTGLNETPNKSKMVNPKRYYADQLIDQHDLQSVNFQMQNTLTSLVNQQPTSRDHKDTRPLEQDEYQSN